MSAEGFGTIVKNFEVGEEGKPVIELAVPVPKGAKTAMIFGVAHLTAFNSDEGGAGFVYADLWAGNDFGSEHYIDYDTGKWNNLSASNNTKMSVKDLKEVEIKFYVRADKALDLDTKFTTATVNGIVVFE